MYVYRNIAWEAVWDDSGNSERSACLDELEPDEYTLLETIPLSIWKCEEDVFKGARISSSFFNNISDSRIRDILSELFLKNKVDKRWVMTDLKAEAPKMNDEVFITSTDDIPRANPYRNS